MLERGTESVADAVDLATELASWLDARNRFQLDPGLPWFGDALQDTLDQAAQTGERMIASYPFVAGGARSILDALTNAATAMGLILAAPSFSEVENAAH